MVEAGAREAAALVEAAAVVKAATLVELLCSVRLSQGAIIILRLGSVWLNTGV